MVRCSIVELIEDHESKIEDNTTRIKFKVSANDEPFEEIVTNNKLLEYISKDIMQKFKPIIFHEGPGHPKK
jgi:hypothetical protein